MPMLSIEDIVAAAQRIEGDVIRTPLMFSPVLSRIFASAIYLKMENLQKTGSFKIRGATHFIKVRHGQLPPLGVVAASAGNHAQGVALAARQAGVAATIVMPEGASISKQEATRAYGGRVVLTGQTVAEAIVEAENLAREGRALIHPYDDPLVIAGQGTIGLEIMADLPEVDRIVAPVGGGGLIAGLALAVKRLKPEVAIIGVQAAGCAGARAALQAGRVTPIKGQTSIADGINVRCVGRHTFPVMQTHVDDILLVEEDEIAAAILRLMETKKIVAEGAGAVPLAALLSRRLRPKAGEKTVLLISGGNLDSPLLGRIISRGLLQSGRIMRVGVVLDDVPGALARLLDAIAAQKANVLHIYHNRSRRDLPVNQTLVELELETRGEAHVAAVERALHGTGYRLTVC